MDNGQVENISPGLFDNPVSGAVNALAPHPTNPDVLYVAAVNGGIWRTANATAAKPSWYRLDRLGRTAKGLITLRDELIARGLNLISLRDSLDLSTPSGRLMFGIVASVAEYETEVRRERQMAGISAVREKGKRIGGRKAGASNHKTRDVLPAVLALHKEGKRASEIARATRLSRPTIYSLLQHR